MTMASGTMKPYLHFTPGDILWFDGWVPASTGAMVGTCIGLFLLAIIERWIGACRAVMEVHWAARAEIAYSEKKSESVGLPQANGRTPLLRVRKAPPFIAAHDVARGVMQIAQSALGYAFMLTVMTFQLGFIMSLLVGLGVGEMLFGRFTSAGAHLS
ncbi:hypothetical protein PLICRDRAFT_119044 [Plicaturopsis crispa FD-325 SS-3]|uniref:Copper transport protein n=1 Tax=Plicaturopsis crispa FD-325 SS-3 TaxID=944288 RepID=A0A0C9T6N8_PLICR|nr:hypothetical protein PLICRDRAFT_119044 [Plicaturopsis crispa FD-325 SS-3]